MDSGGNFLWQHPQTFSGQSGTHSTGWAHCAPGGHRYQKPKTFLRSNEVETPPVEVQNRHAMSYPRLRLYQLQLLPTAAKKIAAIRRPSDGSWGSRACASLVACFCVCRALFRGTGRPASTCTRWDRRPRMWRTARPRLAGAAGCGAPFFHHRPVFSPPRPRSFGMPTHKDRRGMPTVCSVSRALRCRPKGPLGEAFWGTCNGALRARGNGARGSPFALCLPRTPIRAAYVDATLFWGRTTRALISKYTPPGPSPRARVVSGRA